jgi:hypothetical protein
MGSWTILLAFLGLGCGHSEYAVSELQTAPDVPIEGTSAVQQPAEPAAQAAAKPAERWQPFKHHGSSASFRAETTEDKSTFQESFWFGEGATTAMADYLFVVDDSVSMENILDSFHQGFEALSESDAFPAHARIAVMNMTPADPDNLRRRHPIVPFRAHADRSPGFLRLVDDYGIERLNRMIVDRGAEPLEYQGCASWFSPKEKNAQGVPCLLAHTQLALRRSVAEAGLVAFRQLLLKHRSAPVFREGAAVNVIFVSDTHGPGFGVGEPGSVMEEAFEELRGLQPNYAQLKRMVEGGQLVSSFRVHAIAPETECSEPWMDSREPVYFEVAREGGGVIADSCTTTDYSQVIRSIAELGAEIQSGVYPLSLVDVGQKIEVEAVLLDDIPVSWTMSPSGRALVIDEDMASSKAEIKVRYRVGPSARVRPLNAQPLERSRQAR